MSKKCPDECEIYDDLACSEFMIGLHGICQLCSHLKKCHYSAGCADCAKLKNEIVTLKETVRQYEEAQTR